MHARARREKRGRLAPSVTRVVICVSRAFCSTEQVACVASVSARVRRESWDESKKKKEWRGRERGKNETLARKLHDFEKLRSPTNAVFDWCGAGSVNYLALETSIKPGMLCLRASQIWFQITNALDWYLFESCLCEGLWDQKLQSIIGDRAVETKEGQFIGNDGVRIWLEKMDCLLEITSM